MPRVPERPDRLQILLSLIIVYTSLNVLKATQRYFGKWTCFNPQVQGPGEATCESAPIKKSSFQRLIGVSLLFQLRTGTHQFSENFYLFLER